MSGAEQDLSGFSMEDLFRQEVATQAAVLTEGLLAIERGGLDASRLEALMRAAHSIKGAARIVSLQAAVQVAHAMEDCFVAAQQGLLAILPAQADILLRGVDFLSRAADATGDTPDDLLRELAWIREAPQPAIARPPEAAPAPGLVGQPEKPVTAPEPGEHTVRIGSAHLSRMLAMIGESHVQTRWVEMFSASLLSQAQRHADLCEFLEMLSMRFADSAGDPDLARDLEEARRIAEDCRRLGRERLEEFELWTGRRSELAERLYRTAVASRMRPFADGVQGLPRMVRDLARELGKSARLEILGLSTQVDREILERLDAPLAHLLRNALDHGVEAASERQAAGKPPEALLTLEARHRAGLLSISVSDDGRGIDLEDLRARIVARGLSSPEMAATLSEAELFDFLFLPGFSTVERVTEISGRGVGLDIVRTLTQDVGGALRLESRPGLGTRIQLELPVTLSVLRCLLVEVAGEPFALPLTRIDRLTMVDPAEVTIVDGRPAISLDGRPVGLADARAVLDLAPGEPVPALAHRPVVIVKDTSGPCGLVVDRLLGERKLAVRPLEAQLGKVPGVIAVSVLDDGSPILILDAEDLARLIQRNLTSLDPPLESDADGAGGPRSRRCILVVDDSLTVREIERRLLEERGYTVEVAVDGIDGWNRLKGGRYDLVVSDVDMPRMNGIELVRRIRQDARLRLIPLIIVSYKDRDEDRRAGLDAGANAYLTKSSFQDASFLTTVADMLGES
jgi:two-component system, chemotaxis family, sensor histidine kinase and response regulator WspE